MSDPFDVYKLPPSLAEGFIIELAGTPAKFTVKLPARANEDFTTRLLVKLAEDARGDNERVNLIQTQMVRKKLFFAECILSAEGLPEGMDVNTFFETYPLAMRDVWEIAQLRANDVDAEVDEALGKLSPTPSGQHSGQDEPSNTTTSSPQASSLKRQGRKSAA